MSVEYFIIGILVSLLIGQQAYWSFICFKLTDKLMSRNYQEYATYARKPDKVIEQVDQYDPAMDEQAKKANAIFGLV